MDPKSTVNTDYSQHTFSSCCPWMVSVMAELCHMSQLSHPEDPDRWNPVLSGADAQ